MLATELFDAYRSETGDNRRPYFWSGSDIWRYMNDAYSMFVRLTGGIGDTSSDITRVDITAGERQSTVSTKILKFREARLNSNGVTLKIINYTDFPLRTDVDYGTTSLLASNNLPGEVKYMVIGEQRGFVSWARVPEVDDSVSLSVYRLPLCPLSDSSPEIVDVDEEHHNHLLLWMKALGYDKHDADTFNPDKRDACKQAFMDYCTFVKAELERARSKVRSVAYGGY